MRELPERASTAAASTSQIRLEQRHDGQLWAHRGDLSTPVFVVRCFPWSDAGRFISLRDENDDEVALVESPDDLDPVSREALEQSLAVAGFLLEIERVTSCEEEVEIRCWEVETRQGPRRFQTRRDDWPREIPGGGLLVRDVAGDLFVVRDPEELDRRSQALLWAFVDE